MLPHRSLLVRWEQVASVPETGEHAYRRDDGIAVIPASLLGP